MICGKTKPQVGQNLRQDRPQAGKDHRQDRVSGKTGAGQATGRTGSQIGQNPRQDRNTEKAALSRTR
jgi:hypothetical protein